MPAISTAPLPLPEVPSDWPHRASSRAIRTAGVDWHVQVMGTGPGIVLLHGSGAASHSWRDVAARLEREFTVIIPDLPSHGFTSRPRDDDLSLEGMAAQLAALLDTIGVEPVALAGHSAGGAVALRLATLRASRGALKGIVGVNAALTPPSELLPVAAPAMRALARSSMVGALTAWLAESDTVFRTLMRSTGSTIAADQFERYRAFAQSSKHTSALMTMFASWDMTALQSALPSLALPVTLVVGTTDGWIPPVQSRRIARTLPNARVIEIDAAGHLAHEEFPDRVASIIADAARGISVTGHPSERATRAE